nr:unnamed protein product [uncultured bacterium]
MGLFSSIANIVKDPLGSFSGKDQQANANAMAMQAWDMANDYNNPINQMKRLQAAGLNPNLVYGSGSVTGNTTSAPALTGGQYSYGLDKLVTGGNKVASLLKNSADIANTQAQTQLAGAQATTAGAQAANLNAQTTINEKRASYEEKSLIADIDYKQALARKTGAEASIAEGEAELFGKAGGAKGASALAKGGSTAIRLIRGVMK